MGTTTAGNIGNALVSGGNARASGYVAGASGVNQGINNALYAYLYANRK